MSTQNHVGGENTAMILATIYFALWLAAIVTTGQLYFSHMLQVFFIGMVGWAVIGIFIHLKFK
jgi:hypothetical protein